MEIVGLLLLTLFVLFPLYTLVRLAQLGGEIAELKRTLAHLQRLSSAASPPFQPPAYAAPDQRQAAP